MYDTAATSDFARVAVESEPVAAFITAVDALVKATRDVREDEYWGTGIALFRRACFLVRATPLQTTNPALGLLASLATAEEHFKSCAALYPEYASSVEATARELSNLFHSGADPLTDAIREVSAESAGARTGVVLSTRGLDDVVQAHLRRLTGDVGVDALNPRELLNKRPYDRLFVIGSPGWYVWRGWGWVFTAPRGKSVWLVGYPADAARALPSYRALSDSKTSVAPPRDDFADLPTTPPAATDNDHDFEFDWRRLADRMASEVSSGHGGESVESRLYLLSGGYATFLSVSDDSRVQALDPDAPPGARIVNIAPADLEPGAFVMLRSEGGGDLVVIVANSILGNVAATELRSMQSEWKSRLGELVTNDGYATVVRKLKSEGSNVASRANVANWCWHRSLRTWDRADFDAIMKVTGLAEEADAYWKAMGALEAAHRRAGFEIRERLEQQAEAADLGSLETYGMADFSLPEGGGALTAYRVDEVSPTTAAIPEQQLGRPFRVGT